MWLRFPDDGLRLWITGTKRALESRVHRCRAQPRAARRYSDRRNFPWWTWARPAGTLTNNLANCGALIQRQRQQFFPPSSATPPPAGALFAVVYNNAAGTANCGRRRPALHDGRHRFCADPRSVHRPDGTARISAATSSKTPTRWRKSG